MANTVDVKEQGPYGIPKEYNLAQNYPNPFNPTTRIEYALPHESYVTLKIYNILGQEVVTLVDGIQEAGYRRQEWRADGVASGVYFYRIDARPLNGGSAYTNVRKMLVIR